MLGKGGQGGRSPLCPRWTLASGSGDSARGGSSVHLDGDEHRPRQSRHPGGGAGLARQRSLRAAAAE